MKKYISILLIALVFTACEEEKEKSLEFEQYSLDRSFNDCDPEQGDCTFISLNYPLAINDNEQAKRMNKEIEKHIIEIVDYQESDSIETPEGMAEAFLKNYGETASEFPEYELPWEVTVSGDMSLKSEKLISVQFNAQLFTGGAHGYSSTTFLNFDPETGKTYSNKQLFTPEFRDFVEKEFRKEQEIPEGENINSTGMLFENDSFRLPENIGFTDKNIILYYNPYEVAAYAQGSLSMEFSYPEIQKYLKIKPKG